MTTKSEITSDTTSGFPKLLFFRLKYALFQDFAHSGLEYSVPISAIVPKTHNIGSESKPVSIVINYIMTIFSPFLTSLIYFLPYRPN
ncbi:hypothetical protein IWX80_002596 [Flavobacterium sp. CAN_S2]